MGKKQKFLSSHKRADQFTVETAIAREKEVSKFLITSKVAKIIFLFFYSSNVLNCGKGITSFMFFEFVPSICNRSMPIPTPPVGGIP